MKMGLYWYFINPQNRHENNVAGHKSHKSPASKFKASCVRVAMRILREVKYAGLTNC
jgi:hypothetical protein